VDVLALSDAADKPFDAIILDLRMPNMNGVEFIRALAQCPRQRDTPVVITDQRQGLLGTPNESSTAPYLQQVSMLTAARAAPA
jgi:DNA-binding NtrC family response regulator